MAMESNQERWLIAGDVEFRFRVWVFAGMFFAAFQLYWWDHVTAAVALASLLTRSGGNPQAIERVIFFAGAALALAAAALRTWAAAYMNSDVVHDPRVHDSRLVADGPYRYVRNPLYLGTMLMAIAIATSASRSGFVFLVLAITFFQYRLILREERALKATQGESYLRYLAQVPRLFWSLRPRVPEAGTAPRWGQAFRGELFMWAFAVTFLLFAATESVRVLMWGCIAAAAMVLLVGRWAMWVAKRQAAQ